MRAFDVMVIGGGVVGASVAYGCSRRGARVAVIDGSDTDLRASRANFGLIWVQGKGSNFPEYQRWTRHSAELWRHFSGEIAEFAGQNLQHRRGGGLAYCLGEAEFEEKRNAILRMHNQLMPGEYECRMLDRDELQALHPDAPLGPEVTGAAFCPQDGDIDPLRLLNGLHAGLKAQGVTFINGGLVDTLSADGQGFAASIKGEVIRAGKVVIAAGHGSPKLAEAVGIAAPLIAERGQILVTERLAPFLPMPAATLRQTGEGTVMIGASHERVGLDIGTTVSEGAVMAQNAIRVFPHLANAKFVRTWAGLRVLTPDGAPIYTESQRHPGAFFAACHSGVTLAAAHANTLAEGIVQGKLPDRLAPFSPDRFAGGQNVQAA